MHHKCVCTCIRREVCVKTFHEHKYKTIYIFEKCVLIHLLTHSHSLEKLSVRDCMRSPNVEPKGEKSSRYKYTQSSSIWTKLIKEMLVSSYWVLPFSLYLFLIGDWQGTTLMCVHWFMLVCGRYALQMQSIQWLYFITASYWDVLLPKKAVRTREFEEWNKMSKRTWFQLSLWTWKAQRNFSHANIHIRIHLYYQGF